MLLEAKLDEFFDYVMTAMTGVPVALKTKLRDTMRPRYHGHVGAVMAIEIIYRNKDVLPVALLNIGANLAEAADEASAGGMNVERRGFRIGAAIRKIAGTEVKPAPVVTTDPKLVPEAPRDT